MTLRKKLILNSLLVVVVAVAAEVMASVVLWGARGSPPALVEAARLGLQALLPATFPDEAGSRRLTRLPAGFYVPDGSQGYRANPGRYVFRYSRVRDSVRQHVDTVVTVNPDGTRFTGTAPADPERRIVVLGDSFVFGDGVNDEQTFGFLLQTALPDAAIQLHALGGYSWVNALLTIERLADSLLPSDIVVLGYAAYYKERHVAAPARLRSIRDWMASSFPDVVLDPGERLARARLQEGHLVVDTISMHCKFDPANCTAPDPDPRDVDRVSSALLQAIAARSPAPVLLVHFFGPKDDPVLRDLPGNVSLVSATPSDFSYVMRDDIMGFDDHGGPYWHYALYTRMREAMAPLLPRGGDPKARR